MFNSLFLLGLVVSSCSSDDQDKVTTCTDRIKKSANASQALENATEDNYTNLCIEYKTAIRLQIDGCGDQNGTLQADIDALEDCS